MHIPPGERLVELEIAARMGTSQGPVREALQAPFGGFEHSSANILKEQGPAAVEFYTRTKTIYVGHG